MSTVKPFGTKIHMALLTEGVDARVSSINIPLLTEGADAADVRISIWLLLSACCVLPISCLLVALCLLRSA